jgi:serine/threonine-protein kinase
VSVAYKHVREDPVPATERNPDIPADLEVIVATALAKDPERRYQTADDMRADILRFRRGRPVLGAPASALLVDGVAASATQAVATTTAPAAYAATAVQPKVDERGRMTGTQPVARKKRNTTLVWILTLLGLAAVIAAILYGATKLGNKQGTVSVPNVVAKNVAVATQEMQNAHLTPSVHRVANASVPVDIVVRQDPAAGQDVSRGSTVNLFVSGGPATKQVPNDIIGQTADAATLKLQAAGFVVAQKQQANPTADQGTVFDSSPKPGATAPDKSTVTIFVSTGPAPVAVPSVKGLTLDDARSQLVASGFTNFNTPIEESSTSFAPGQVTRTDPPAGKAVPISTRITIYVSRGAPTVTMPSVIGETKAQAKADLQADGFTVQTLNTLDAANAGRVVDQRPAPGTEVAPNSNVVLTIAIAPATTTQPTTSTTGP